jgi:hypothetical protein
MKLFQKPFDGERGIFLDYLGRLPSGFVVALPVNLILENVFMFPLPSNPSNHPTLFSVFGWAWRENKLEGRAIRRLEATRNRANVLSKELGLHSGFAKRSKITYFIHFTQRMFNIAYTHFMKRRPRRPKGARKP